MKHSLLKAFFFFLFLNFIQAETLSERYTSFAISPEKVFYTPQSSLEKDYYNVGQLKAWQRYSINESPASFTFNGYILFADPFHEGHKKISFLLGADCSSFVHRLFQLIGADYPFVKTRHFLAYAKNKERPEGINVCMWENFKKTFTVVGSEEVQLGDVVVYGTTLDEFGERGHMGIVASLNPFAVLQSKYKKGFIQEELNYETFLVEKKPYFFRYSGAMREIEGRDFKKALELNYPFNNSGCEYTSP